jgi:hypothetical protein
MEEKETAGSVLWRGKILKTKIRKVSIKCLTSIEFGCGKKASQNSFVKLSDSSAYRKSVYIS